MDWQPNIGDEVEITENCGPLGIKIGDKVTVIEYKDGAVLFNCAKAHSCWTSSFKKASKSCTCTMNDLLLRGCQCGGN